MTTGSLNQHQSSTSLSDRCSRTAFLAAKGTFDNGKDRWGEAWPTLDHYFCQLLKTPTHILAVSSDGIGTKIEVAERCQIFNTLGYDLVAMVVDDIICSGAEPTHLSNILDVDKLDHKVVDELFSGLISAACEARIMITGGETAELGSRIQGYGHGMHFNWCATGMGILASNTKPIDGSRIREGDAVISLKSPGLRSNGFSKARAILESRFGELWHLERFSENETWGERLLSPSIIYAPYIVDLLKKGVLINGIAHITGGGIAANFERILSPWNKGAMLHTLHSPHQEIAKMQEWAGFSDRECYETWNMGNGMLLVVAPNFSQVVIDELLENNIHAQRAGFITEEPCISISSPVHQQSNIYFEYDSEL